MAIGKGHQAIMETVYGTTKLDKGKLTVVNVKRYPAEQVNPPEGVKSADWIKNGFKKWAPPLGPASLRRRRRSDLFGVAVHRRARADADLRRHEDRQRDARQLLRARRVCRRVAHRGVARRTATRRCSPTLVLLAAAMLVSVVVAPLIERGILRFMYAKDEVVILLITYALFLILEDVIKLVWGVNPYYIAEPYALLGSFTVGGLAYPTYNLILVALALVSPASGSPGCCSSTRVGKLLRAVIHDPEVSRGDGHQRRPLLPGDLHLRLDARRARRRASPRRRFRWCRASAWRSSCSPSRWW